MAYTALGLGLFNAGMKIFGGMSKQRTEFENQKRQVRAANVQAQMQREAQNRQIRAQNSYAQYEYGIRKQMAQQQMQYNAEAAIRGYQSTQENRLMQLKQMAFERQNRAMQLLEAAGATSASIEGDNRSAQLAAAKATFGEYGRQKVQDAESVKDLNRQARHQMQDIFLQHKTANLEAYSQVAVQPYMQSELGPAAMMGMPRGPSFLSQALMIGGGIMDGLGTYNQFAAPQDRLGFKGIKATDINPNA